VDLIPELTKFKYKITAGKAINTEEMIKMISNANWEPKEIGLEYSQYVEFLMKEFQTFSRRLNKESKQLPQKVKNVFWEATIIHVMEQLVEGYSRVKKCNQEGRVLMALDLQNIQTLLEKLANIRPVPHVGYVEAFIKAFYLTTEETIFQWCKEHPEYTLKQWLNVVNVGAGAQMTRKNRQTLIQQLEDLDKTRGKPIK